MSVLFQKFQKQVLFQKQVACGISHSELLPPLVESINFLNWVFMFAYASLATVVITSSDLEANRLALSSKLYARTRSGRIIL